MKKGIISMFIKMLFFIMILASYICTITYASTIELYSNNSKYIEARYKYTKDQGKTRNFIRDVLGRTNPNYINMSKTERLTAELSLANQLDSLGINGTYTTSHGNVKAIITRITNNVFKARIINKEERNINDEEQENSVSAPEEDTKPVFIIEGVRYKYYMESSAYDKKGNKKDCYLKLINVQTGEFHTFYGVYTDINGNSHGCPK